MKRSVVEEADQVDVSRSQLDRLEERVHEIYAGRHSELPFHGAHHIAFVRMKAKQFAEERDANVALVEAAALVHDLNYVVRKNSEPEAGRRLRQRCLDDAGFDRPTVVRVEAIILEAHTATRSETISPEGSALSDADTLFKALPITPVVFSHRYLDENGVGLRTLCEKILEEQRPLLDGGIYFYDERVRDRYLRWATVNLELWRMIEESLDDDDVTWLLKAFAIEV